MPARYVPPPDLFKLHKKYGHVFHHYVVLKEQNCGCKVSVFDFVLNAFFMIFPFPLHQLLFLSSTEETFFLLQIFYYYSIGGGLPV